MKLILCLLSVLVLAGCYKDYKGISPDEAIYGYDNPAFGSDFLHSDEVYEDAFGAFRSQQTNQQVHYLGTEPRIEMLGRQNVRLEQENEILLHTVREELSRQRLDIARNRQ